MPITIEHDVLDEALRACGSDWTAAQAHGLLCGQLAVSGRSCITTWQAQVLADGEATPTGSQCGALLERMAESTWYRLAERQSQFDVVLPDDDEDSTRRAQALADWAEGFLHGLVSYSRDEAVRKRLAEEPLSDLIRDLLELTRAEVGPDDSAEETELAYTELVEYVRVAAQLAFEQLADVRTDTVGSSPSGLLH